MRKLQSWLAGLLVLQVALAVGLFWNSQQSQQQASKPLLSFAPDQLNRVVISDGKKSVTMRRDKGHWILPDLDSLPVSDTKLNEMLSRMQALRTGWPVATTSASHERFKVADDKFERRIQLYNGDTLAGELYVGTSPGFRKSHIRKAKDDNVYTAGLNSFDLPVKTDGWLDKTLIAANDLDSIKGSDYQLKKKDGNWQLDTAAAPASADATASAADASVKLNPEKARDLASALGSLQVETIAKDPTVKDATRTTLDVSGPKGQWTYSFVKSGDHYYVSRSDRKLTFSLSQLDYDRIAKIDRSDLAASQAKPTAEVKQAAKDKADASANKG